MRHSKRQIIDHTEHLLMLITKENEFIFQLTTDLVSTI